MPCRSDYMYGSEGPNKELSRVACLLDELDGKSFKEEEWDGNHPKVWEDSVSLDRLTAQLCKRLQKFKDITKYSLEMQIWWRDHQAADKERLRREIKEKETKMRKKAALAKLTSYERKLLGV